MRGSSIIRQTLTSPTSSKFAPSPLARLIRSHIISADPSTLSAASSSASSSSSSASATSEEPIPGPIHLTIPNPFASRRISLRTQSDLLKSFPPTWLPPSRKNPLGAKKITYDQDGVVVTWTGGNLSEKKQVVIPNKQPSGIRPSDKKMGDFRGRKVDRVAKDRRAETEARLEGMEKRIEEWRQVSLGLSWSPSYEMWSTWSR